MDGMLGQAFVYLAAAVAGVPLAKRLGLGSVLGYLLAGAVIGPHVLGLVGHESAEVMHVAEFGVVMMLFLVGLELKPALLWELRRPILGLGGLQVLGTTLAFAAAALALGLGWRAALAIGAILSMSSTAIVLQSLGEKGQLRSAGGQASFSVLLFQDIAVIPILAIFPLLAATAPTEVAGVAARPGWLQALLVFGAVAGLILAGRFLVRPLFRLLAEARLREAFTAAALLLVVGIALLMQQVGLSPALGTFLAGVVLAESEYRHELESDLEPFKGLLLGLFFLSVGSQLDFALVARSPGTIAGLVATLMLGKLAILYALGRGFGLDRASRWLFAFSLAQVGEFAFVLLGFAVQSRIFDGTLASTLAAAVALSMALTPLAFLALERLVLPRVTGGTTRAHDEIAPEGNPVVMAGFGRFGQVTGRILRASGIGATVLDLDPAMVELLRRLELKVHYGDASRPELLHAAGCAHAKLFVLAVDDPARSVEIAATVRRHFPKLPILARARNRTHYYELKRLGIDVVVRETMGSALELASATLRGLGYRAHTAERLTQKWRAHDEEALHALEKLWGGDEATYFAAAKKALADAEEQMKAEVAPEHALRDAGWDPAPLREAVAARARATDA